MRFDEKLAYEDTIHYLKLENKQLGRELRGAKAELVENDAIIKKQNQTLLHINAEIEFIQEHPFDSVLITGSVENISNVIKGQTEPIIDEGCVGCCKVVDVAAKLQEELNECSNMNLSLHEDIEELKDKNIEDLHELYDLYEDELRGIKADRTSIKSDRDIMFRNYRNTVAKLQDDIGVLEAELSALKQDSEVLMKVVDVVNDDTISRFAVPWRIRCIVEDYLDAPEGPPEITIDEPQEIKVTVAWLELP